MKKKISKLSPKKKLEKLRNNIDNIDLKILNLIARRRREVLKVIKIKPKNKIVDPIRIEKMIKDRIASGKKLKIEKFIVKNIWKRIIETFIQLERKKYK
tara:strand:+ start:229 stop:525 length:297 start_codon:yes stop_codon:yes gene_type:complete